MILWFCESMGARKESHNFGVVKTIPSTYTPSRIFIFKNEYLSTKIHKYFDLNCYKSVSWSFKNKSGGVASFQGSSDDISSTRNCDQVTLVMNQLQPDCPEPKLTQLSAPLRPYAFHGRSIRSKNARKVCAFLPLKIRWIAKESKGRTKETT